MKFILVPLSVATLALLFSTGCEFRRDNRPSILVIAVENLGFDSVSCESEDDIAGFDTFCEEGIRFTHAFTPSTMSQSALSSILTGMYPTRHNVHNNGGDFLSARFRTVAEAANDKRYRTGFISGGPPIFRKSGLSQGFEYFDDNLDLALDHYYRPSGEIVSTFEDWLNKDVSSSPYLAFLYLADLQFPDAPTFTNEGNLREKTVESQLQAVGESLQSLIDTMKAKRIWHGTHVVLLGLSGGMVPSELKSDNTQVTLMIKPARQARDLGTHWTIDRNVSLVDVGQTIFSILGEATETMDNEIFEKVSLQSVLQVPEPDWRDDRIIYSESGWTKWRLGGDIRVALRQRQFLFINDPRPMVFNSLSDHMEKNPIGLKDPLWMSNGQAIMEARSHLPEMQTHVSGPTYPIHIFEVGRTMWMHHNLSEDLERELEDVIDKTDREAPLGNWWARWALEREDWTTLSRLGQTAHKPFWAFVGDSRLGLNPHALPDSLECANLFRGTQNPTGCSDELLMSLHRWIQEKTDEEKFQKRERAVRQFVPERLFDRVGQLHYINNVKWDVRLEYPRAPSLAELYLALPRNRVFATQISNILGPKDLGL